MSKKRTPTVNPSEWLIPARDQLGHSAMYQFRAPEDWGRRMEEIVTSNKFPFKTTSDIMRWCWWEGMIILTQLEPGCTDLSQISAAQRVVRDAEDQQRFLSLFERVGRVIDQAVEDKDEGRARKLIADLRYQFEQMPEGVVRERYLEKLKKWDWILDRGAATPLTKLSQQRKRRLRPQAQEEDEA